MTKICIVFDHPYTAMAYDNQPHHRSFSAALLHAIQDAYHADPDTTVDLIDLHADQFDPVMHEADLNAWRQRKSISPQVADYQERVLAADEIYFVFPIWWELMPAMTKGFIDKVIAPGLLYTQTPTQKRFTSKLTQLKKVTLVTTLSTPNLLYRLIFGNPVTKAMFRGIFLKMGFSNCKWYHFNGVDKKTFGQRQLQLKKFKKQLL